MPTFVVYMIRCNNGSLYTGYTTDLARRYRAHEAGQCKYTRSFKPVAIAGSWLLNTKSEALRLECYIKTLSRLQKERLLLAPERLSELGIATPVKE